MADTPEPRFQPILDLLDCLARDHPDGGELELAVFVDGQRVLGASLRRSDVANPEPLLAPAGSAFKAIVAISLLQALDDRGIDLDAPLEAFTSRFRVGSTTARQLLEHRAGLPHIRDIAPTCFDLREPGDVASALARLLPLWKPGTRSAYHAVSYGYLIQNVIEDLCGSPIVTLMWQRLLHPAGVTTNHVGVGAGTGATAKVTPLTLRGEPSIPWRPEGRSILYRSLYPLSELVELLNRDDGVGATVLSCGVPCSAEALARVYSALGAPIGTESAIASEVRSTVFTSGSAAFDHVMLQRLTWRCGLLQGGGIRSLSGNSEVLGLPGYGGSIGLCDRKRGVAIGIVASQLDADRVVGRETEQLCLAVLKATQVDR